MLRQTSFLISTLIFFAFSSITFANEIFTDLNEGHFAYYAIHDLKDRGIVNGYEDGTFKPTSKINRAEFLKIVLETANLSEENKHEINGGNCFPDVQGQWFAPYVCTAHKLGIVDGYPDGKFYPGNEINFVEASKIIVNTLKLEVDFANNETWYQPFVVALANRHAIPQTVTSFNYQISRADMACLVYNVLNNTYIKHSCNSNLSYAQIADLSSTAVDESTWNLLDPIEIKPIHIHATSGGDYLFFQDKEELFLACGDNASQSVIKIDGIEPENFKYLGSSRSDYDDKHVIYFTDGNKVYFTFTKEQVDKASPSCDVAYLENSDPDSFKVLTPEYAKDKNNVYYLDYDSMTTEVGNASNKRIVRPVDGVKDVNSFWPAYLSEIYISDYFQDDYNIYVPDGDYMSIVQAVSNKADDGFTRYWHLTSPNIVSMAGKMGFIFYDGTDSEQYIGIDKRYLHIDGEKYNLPSGYTDFLASKNHWILKVTADSQSYVFINGSKYGPYEKVYSEAISDNNWAFSYESAGLKYVNINGQKFGPYDELKYDKISLSDNHKAFIFGKDNGEEVDMYVNVDGEEFGPYSSVQNLKVTEDLWSFRYDDQYFIVNGEEYGPHDFGSFYNNVWKDHIIEVYGDNWAFVYTKDDEVYVRTKNKEYGPYKEVDNLRVGQNAWMFSHDDEYVNVNGKEYGPYSYIPSTENSDPLQTAVSMVDQDHWGFVFSDESGEEYVNINDKVFGPYQDPEILVTEDDWVIKSKNEEGQFFNISGNLYGPYEPELLGLEEIGLDGEGFYFPFSKDGQIYFNVNGQVIGPFQLSTISDTYYFNNDFTLIGSYYSKGDFMLTNSPELFADLNLEEIRFLDPAMNVPIPEFEPGG